MSCILVGASGAAQATAATSEARTQAPEASATDSALDEMAACLRSREHLLLVLLIDESGSLRSTDPQNERVTAARLALRSFASLSSTRATAEQPQIEVLVAGFSSSFDAVTPWTALDDDSVGGVEVSVDAFAGRDDGIDTDFPVALIGARRELASRSAELSEGGDAEPCKAILLFTDGRYDVETGDTPARREAGIEKDYAPGVSLLDPASGPVVEAAGRDLLCRTDGSGLADRLRADGAAVVTVALAAQIDAADQDFLRALSTGSSGTLTCGDPAGENAGAYLAAEELSELAPAFARVATSIAGATEAPGSAVVETCNGTECESGRRAFDLDPILLRFSVLADTRSEGTSMAVRAPHSADPVVVVPGTDGEAVLDGVALRWSWVSDTAVELNADLPAGRDSWIGEWSVTFVDPDSTGVPDRPRADVFLYGGWTPDLPTDTNLLRGAEADLVVVVIDAAGTPVGGEALTDAGARLDATVTDPTTDETVALRLRGPDAQGRYRAKYTAGADITASTLDLDLRLIAQTATGVELSPSTARYQLEVGLPDLYPHVTTPEIRLTSVRGTGTARGTVDIVGGRDRPGCVWFEPPEFESFPAEAVSLSYELSTPATAEDCIELVPGETRHVDIFIRPTASSEGTVRGALTVFLSARGESEPLSVVVPLSFDVAPPINQARRLGLFVGILLAGVLAPLAALVLLNRSLARFEPPNRVVWARVPVSVERTVYRVLREHSLHGADNPDAVPGDTDVLDGLRLDPAAFVPLGDGDTRTRELTCGDLELSAHAPRNPLGDPYGTVTCERPCSAGGPHRTSAEPPERVPLALPGSWVFVLGGATATEDSTASEQGAMPDASASMPAGDDMIAGELVVFLAAGPLEEQIDRVGDSLRERLAIVANDLSALHHEGRR